MKLDRHPAEHAELLILPDGRILAHNVTPEVAAILSALEPRDEPMAQRADLQGRNETPAGH